jgi:hypothetical protein
MTKRIQQNLINHDWLVGEVNQDQRSSNRRLGATPRDADGKRLFLDLFI